MKRHGPVLAVLPLRAAVVSEAESVVGRGFIEDLAGELARFPTIEVIAAMSGLAVADLPDREAAERLQATHVLRIRFQNDGGRLRIRADLVDGASGAQIWSEKLEAAEGALFEIQDELVARTAAMLAFRLEDSLLKQVRRKRPESLAAYELTLKGLALLRNGSFAADEEARRLFERALELDPHYARAHAGLSLSWFNEWSCQFWERFHENGRLAYEHAHRALEIDDSDAMLHLVVGRILLYRREFEQASWYFDRALMLCPNDAELLIQLVQGDVFLGRPETAMALAEKAMRLNPYHPNYYYAYAAFPHFVERDFARALEIGGRAVGAPIIDIPAYTAIALANLGCLDEARRHFAFYNEEFRKRITFGREPEPGEAIRWLIEINPYRRQQDIDLIIEGFRMLGDHPAEATIAIGTSRTEAGELAPMNFIRREGDMWLVGYAGRRTSLPDLKGLHDICRLLEQPGAEIHCLDLAERSDETFAGDTVLDERARQSLKARIRELQEELAEAEDLNDTGRAERLRAELDELVETLSKALGLGGRGRRLGSLAERARTTVTWRIGHAVRKIESVHEPLARHLANSLRTGTFCSYRPEQKVAWQVGAG